MTEIEVIAYTQERKELSEEQMNQDLTILSGKFAGTCYAKEGYETIKTQPVEKALNRANNTAKSGHHSVYQHAQVSMEIKCSKIIAMLLNSIGISNTSEKSARYTKMQPQTPKEEELYYKWHDKFVKMIEEEYGTENFTEKEIDKLSFENARYMISVFTKTSMVYSLPFRNMFYVCDYLEAMIRNLEHLEGGFNQRLKIECEELLEAFTKAAGGQRSLHDNKNEYFRFLPAQAIGEEKEDGKEFYADVYSSHYLASFACVAQEQRHRTLRVKVHFSGKDAQEYGFFVPKLVKKYGYEQEWLEDLKSVKEIYPQATLLYTTEQGLFEDFVLKCKERMCGRAQLEIMDLNVWMVEKFIENKENLSNANKKRLEDMTISGKACPRCMFRDFTCQEGCKWGPKGALGRLI